MDEKNTTQKTWYENLEWGIKFLAPICTILGVSVFGNYALFNDNENDKTITTITITNDNTTSESPTLFDKIATEDDIYIKITTDSVLVRSEPSTDCDIITILSEGTIFLVKETVIVDSAIWYKISLDDNIEGYVISDYTEIIAP